MRRDTGRPREGSPRAALGPLDLVTEDYSAARQVVWRDLDRHPVSLENANAKPPHVAAERRQDVVTVGELDAKGRVGEDFGDLSLELDWFFFRHEGLNLAGECGRAGVWEWWRGSGK